MIQRAVPFVFWTGNRGTLGTNYVYFAAVGQFNEKECGCLKTRTVSLAEKVTKQWLAHYVPLNACVMTNFMLITPRRLNEQCVVFPKG